MNAQYLFLTGVICIVCAEHWFDCILTLFARESYLTILELTLSRCSSCNNERLSA